MTRKSNGQGLRFIRDKIIVDKMLRYADKVRAYCKGISYEEFRGNELLVEACVFNLSQIGELVSKLNDTFREKNRQIAWEEIYGLRNRIVHDYEGVNLRLIWEIIAEDIPALQRELTAIKQQLEKRDTV